MFIFAFNLLEQINLFVKHFFTNKSITTPYYIKLFRPVPFVVLWCPGGWCCHRWSAPRCLVVSWWWLVVLVVLVSSVSWWLIGGVLLGAWW